MNATPLGQSGEAARLPLDAALLDGRVVCDLAYRGDGAETGLIAAARERGARAVDGLEVLAGQGALALPAVHGRGAADRDHARCGAERHIAASLGA